MQKILSVFFVLIFVTGVINAQSKSAIGFNAGTAIPTGDFGDYYDVGWGGSGIFVYHSTPNIDVTFSIGYLTWGGKDSVEVSNGSLSLYVPTADATFSSVPVLVGIKYLFGKEKFLPYIAGDLGAQFVTIKTPDTEINGTTYPGESASDTFFGWDIGAGLVYKINEKIDLDFNAKYNMIMASDITYYGETQTTSRDFYSIMVGLLFGLN
jgi:opacity protein-like surface antigen